MSELAQAQIKITPFKISRFQIAIKGLSPLVMHAWSEKAKRMVRMTPTERKKLPKEERTPEETAHECAYRCDDESFGLPIDAFKKAVTSAAHTDDGVAKTVIRKALFVLPHDKSGNVPLVYDSEPIVTEDKVTVGRGATDLRYRLYFHDWSAVFTIDIDTTQLNVQDVVTLVQRAGYGVGIGDWRPQRDGDKGRFEVDTTQGIKQLDMITNEIVGEVV